MDNAHQAKLEAARQRYMKLPDVWQLAIALGVFIGAKGKVWRDHKGYHARAWASEPIALVPLEVRFLGKVHSVARGKVVCNITVKDTVIFLHKQLYKLMPDRYPPLGDSRPVGRPKKCKHCGRGVNDHDPECYDAVEGER